MFVYNIQPDLICRMKTMKSIIQYMPTSWGAVQNNKMDGIVNVFDINDYCTLIKVLESKNCDEYTSNYIKRRWFLEKQSAIDEDIFCIFDNVEKNENRYDKSYDFKINGIPFDLKSTILPKVFSIDMALKEPSELIEWFYNNQSRQRRYGLQNRLFLVHCGDNEEDVIKAKVAYTNKIRTIGAFCMNFDKNNLIEYKGALSSVIFLYRDMFGNYKGWKL